MSDQALPPTAMTDRTLPSGSQVELRAGPYAAAVTEVGACLRALTYRDQPLLLGFPADEMASGGRGQVLLPWPNRIEDGRYDFGGATHQLPLSEPARHNASHGLVRWVPWQLRPDGPATVSAAVTVHPQPGYPFTLGVVIRYTLGGDGLRLRTRTTNLGDRDAPYGHGMHPYLRTPGLVDASALTVPADSVCEVDHRGLPSAPRPVAGTAYDFRSTRTIGELRLDNPFTGLVRDDVGRATVTLQHPGGVGRVELWMDRSYRWLQVYTADTLAPDDRRRAVAVEPMTCPPNAFRSMTDVIRLEPGASHEAVWGIRVG